jgi:hypothetical protein
VLPDVPPVALRLTAVEKSLMIEVRDQSPLDLEPGEVDTDDGRGARADRSASASDDRAT